MNQKFPDPRIQFLYEDFAKTMLSGAKRYEDGKLAFGVMHSVTRQAYRLCSEVRLYPELKHLPKQENKK